MLSLSDYTDTDELKAITPPEECSYAAPAQASLRNIYLNDQLGDCVIAGGYHIVGTETANAGNPFLATKDQIIADYSAIGGYVVGDSNTDNGCNLTTALDYWTKNGFANGTKLTAWARVNSSNVREMQLAIYLFENLYLGMGLPDAWVHPMPSGNKFVWDVAGESNPDQGHCIMSNGYSKIGLDVDTWALEGTLTYGASDKYARPGGGGEMYVLLTPDQINRTNQRAPNGFDFATLEKDFKALTGVTA